MTAALLMLLAACTEGGKEVEDTDVFETVPVNLFVVDREHGCVRYAAVAMPAVWWEGWPEGHDCVDSSDPFMGEIWSGHCAFMPNTCWSKRMSEAEIVFGDGTGWSRGCHESGNEPCDCQTPPHTMPLCGANTTLSTSECLEREWPRSDCGFWPTPL